ncbi:NADAR family protein [Alteromonas macleodii]|uniref:NADAR family protein n=1 Tax=Alteromonas macleodii TaxID=28108 RepID=UPI00298184DE|nr:NADAR family protein [Alteromonas macleodii]MDW5284385.1 NADAR family protein [Alteromonas macleodii]
MTIFFYTKTDEYGDFSNFSKHGIEVDGLWWPTVEHFFQAQKFENVEYQEKIRTAFTPKQAAELGRSRKVPIRKDWEEVKDLIMYQAVLKKFKTHNRLAEILLSTGNQDIVENAPGDYYWGIGQNGTGLNKLGKILCSVRDQLRI